MRWPPSSRSRSCPRKIAPRGIAPASTTTVGVQGAMIAIALTAIAPGARKSPRRRGRRENNLALYSLPLSGFAFRLLNRQAAKWQRLPVRDEEIRMANYNKVLL